MADEKKYYLVRSPVELLTEPESAVGVGWADIPFKDYPIEGLLEKVKTTGWLGRRSQQLRHFKAIKDGDVIVVPLPWAIAIGIASGVEKYDGKYASKNACNQKLVKFLSDNSGKVKFIPRTELKNPLQSRLKIRITVADLTGFADDIEDAMRRAKAGTTWQVEAMLKEQGELQAFKERLLDNIRTGKNTYLAAGGNGLEHLVKELLIVAGYDTAEVAGKRDYKGTGDADVEATRSAWPCDELLLVQVKHHRGTTGAWAMSQLKEIRETMKGYNAHKLVVVTTGEVRPEDKIAAQDIGIDVVDGNELVNWIYESIARLKPETRAKLGVLDIPRFMTA